MTFVLALDQGTTSSRAIVFDADGRIRAMAQKEFAQHCAGARVVLAAGSQSPWNSRHLRALGFDVPVGS